MFKLSIAALVAVSSMLLLAPNVLAGSKQIDWDEKLAKERQLYVTNNVEEAMKIVDKYLEKHPEAGALHCDKGKCLKRRGHVAEAKSEFKRGTEVEENYAENWYELGSVQQSDKEYDLAVNSFERYLQIAPGGDKAGSVKDRINFCKSQQ